MKTSVFLQVALAAALIVPSSFGQAQTPAAETSPAAASGQPSEAELKQMIELAKLTDNHKLLGDLAGTWTYTVKMWMNPDPNASPTMSKGTAVRKPVMGGRFYAGNFTGKMQMPGPDGKMKDFEFKGMSLEGYDNVKQKFISTWVDNMGTGMMMSEGTYDPATKTFSYNSEIEPMPGMKMKVRETIQIVDKDHHVFDWYETHGGQEAKTMEISYTRKK